MALDWTGERFLPGVGASIAYEHYSRYYFAQRYCVGKKVLDVPSGEGYGTSFLAEVAASVIGVDISVESVDHAARKYQRANLSYQAGDLAALPFATASFDVVTCFEGIEHVPPEVQEKALKELRRVLKPEGLLFISTPNKKTYSDLPNFKNEYHTREFYPPEFVALMRADFPEIQLLGQSVVEGSIFHRVDAPGLSVPESTSVPTPGVWADRVNLEQQVKISDFSTDPDEYVYLIGICSAQPVALPPTYFFADFMQAQKTELVREIEKWFQKAKEVSELMETTNRSKSAEIDTLTLQLHQMTRDFTAFQNQKPVRIALKLASVVDQFPRLRKFLRALLRPFVGARSS